MKKNRISIVMTLLLVSMFTVAAVSGVAPEKININQDDHSTLQKLPRIGPAMATRIIEYREANGPFDRIEDLMEVRGIGEKTFMNLRELIEVGPSGTTEANREGDQVD